MKTGIVYDSIFLKHDQPGHPENSKRLVSVMKRLEENKLLRKVKQLESRIAETHEIAICHRQEYIQYVKEFCEHGGGYLDPDTYSNKYSFTAAITAVGSSVDLTKAVINRELKNGFAILRPPGHHALETAQWDFVCLGILPLQLKLH